MTVGKVSVGRAGSARMVYSRIITEPGHGSGKYNQAEHPESGFVQHRVFSCKDDLTQRVNSLPSQSYGLLENQLVHNITKLYALVHTEFSAIKK